MRKTRAFEVLLGERHVGGVTSSYRKTVVVEATSILAATVKVTRAAARGRFPDVHKPEVVQVRRLDLELL